MADRPAHATPAGAVASMPPPPELPPMPPPPVPVLARPAYVPKSARVALPPSVLPAVLAAAVVGAILIPLDRPGIGWLLAGITCVVAVVVADRKARAWGSRSAEAGEGSLHTAGLGEGSLHTAGLGEGSLHQAEPAPRNPSRARILWAALALALLAVGTIRAAEWLFVFCVLAAAAAGSLAAVGPRSVKGLLYDVLAVPIEAFGGLAWLGRGTKKAQRKPSGATKRIASAVFVTLALLAVFVPLLSSADATFAGVLKAAMPEVDGGNAVQWIFVFGLVGAATAGALFVLAAPPRPAEAKAHKVLHRVEWALPVGVLTLLFAGFVFAQLVALFGGDAYVLRTSGLTYAEYARGGFWQLSAITVLTLGVIVIALRWGSKETARDRWWLRGVLTGLSLLTLVIVASALSRMWTYQQAYGFTVLRLLVETCELWLGAVYLLMIAAIWKLDQTWLPRAAIGTAMGALLALAVLDPERFIADRNIDRMAEGYGIDSAYLSTLSADVLPAVERLPEPVRAAVRGPVRAGLGADSWQEFNFSRMAGR
ncbi:DUF4153 domain-containing protein [Amycolatopsis sp. NPDC059657]|uniref:DUF4153 domain-containing protein n=1 Tax=Amycolatopsis sp. NPDC059657 TaxID=3346899 RepID=UPI00367072C5